MKTPASQPMYLAAAVYTRINGVTRRRTALTLTPRPQPTLTELVEQIKQDWRAKPC